MRMSLFAVAYASVQVCALVYGNVYGCVRCIRVPTLLRA